MSDSSPVGPVAFIVLLVLFVFALLIVAGRRAARRDNERIAGLRTWALSQGYAFLDEDSSAQRQLQGWPFESGRRRESRNVIRGKAAGHTFTAFDYSYETTSSSTSADGGSTSSTTTHRRQVLLIEGPSSWPDLSVTPKSLGSRIAVTFGGQDITIGDGDLNRQFRVRADDETGARRLLSTMAPVLISQPEQAVRIDRGVLLAHRIGTLQAGELQNQLEGFGTWLAKEAR